MTRDDCDNSAGKVTGQEIPYGRQVNTRYSMRHQVRVVDDDDDDSVGAEREESV